MGVIPSYNVKVVSEIVVGSIASLKVAVMEALMATAIPRFAGTVEITSGGLGKTVASSGDSPDGSKTQPETSIAATPVATAKHLSCSPTTVVIKALLESSNRTTHR